MFDNLDPYKLLLVGTAVLAVIWLVLKIKAGRRKPRIHPRLQKYAGPDAEYAQKRRAEAAKILATSSTQNIAGYEIKARTQNQKVLEFFRHYPRLEFTPEDIGRLVLPGTPRTSWGRAITVNTKKGFFVKTDNQVEGIWGRPIYFWRLKPRAPIQRGLF